MRRTIFLSLLLLVPVLGNAMTGEELLAKCRASAGSDRVFCEAYIAGVASGAMIASVAMAQARPELSGVRPVFCMPPSTSDEKLTAIAVAFLTAYCQSRGKTL